MRIFFNRSTVIEVSLFVIVLLVALACRALYLDARPFWVDEAESSINALTILERGYPTDAYLGIPIYENTLIQKWPESAEYEFRDVSYSRMHMAVYHGWLPLYAMAGAFAVAKVTPDQVNLSRTVQHNLDERKRRTRVARLPAVLFGLLFLGTVYAGGRLLYGRDAAWTALAIGAIYPYHISLSRQARYYSAQVTLTTACALSFWMLAEDCRWKHVYVAAVTFTLLFYTHLLSFGAAGLVWLLLLPIIIRRHEDAVRKMVVFVLLVAGGTLPWVFASGFYLQQAHIPRAWPLLNLPGDLWRFPPVRAPSAVVGILIAMLAAWVASGKSRLPERVMAPIKRLGPVFLFLIVWAVCGYATFAAFVPAVSFDGSRLNLSYWGPSFLLASVSCAALTRIVTPRHSVLLSPAFLLLAFLVTGHAFGRTEWFGGGTWRADAILFDHIAAMKIDATTKIFAAPNDHLILSFYSGLPVQDITPVRKSYLDAYKGDIIYIDRPFAIDTGLLSAASIQTAAALRGYTLIPEAVTARFIQLQTYDYREAMLKSLARNGRAKMDPLPDFAAELLAAHRQLVQRSLSNSSLELVTRGFPVTSWSDWRAVVKYRFVDPQARSGVHANYVERLRGSSATILTEANAVVYESHWHPPDVSDRITFRFVP